jgi:hypothetical protein
LANKGRHVGVLEVLREDHFLESLHVMDLERASAAPQFALTPPHNTLILLLLEDVEGLLDEIIDCVSTASSTTSTLLVGVLMLLDNELQ